MEHYNKEDLKWLLNKLKMKLEPIEYNGGVIWVDKNTQGYKKGEWCYGEPNNSELLYQFEEDLFPYNLGNKVIAQSSNLSLPNIPYVEVEEDVEQLAKQFIADEWFDSDEPVKFGIKVGYQEGYKQAIDTIEQWVKENTESVENQSGDRGGAIWTSEILKFIHNPK